MKILISGYGRMGHMIESVILEKGLPYAGWSEDVQSVPAEIAAECVCIDFTTPDAFRTNYRCLAEKFKAVVVGTTGWGDIAEEVKACFEQNGTPMIYASNYSIGVNVLFATAKYMGELLKKFGGYEPSIEEIHHIHKLDAPSGTAKSLAAVVEGAMGTEVPVTAQRIGEVPGIHTLTVKSGCDCLTLGHEAFSREGFARGAVQAALMTENLKGVHEFKDIMFD
ncbi:MAG: 4-hydroxy-tetrahydrodipicolinate reductase [Bacteroidales bacterium]|nr:4-hydroxy-tetrahydrodipicolinate reductase [Bacteroidales bacterium]